MYGCARACKGTVADTHESLQTSLLAFFFPLFRPPPPPHNSSTILDARPCQGCIAWWTFVCKAFGCKVRQPLKFMQH